MNFEQAVKLLKQGKKIRRPTWKEGSYIYDTDPVMWSGGDKACFSTKWFNFDDWEEFKDENTEHSMSEEQRKFFNRGVKHGIEISKPDLKEKKTLSDKVWKEMMNDGSTKRTYAEEDVKEHLKRFFDYIDNPTDKKGYTTTKDRERKAKEIFGDDLL